MAASDAFPTLTPEQTERLRAVGTEEAVAAGDFLFREGDAGYDFFAVLAGEVQIYEDAACTRAIVPEPFRAGQFLGEAGLLLGEAVFATARVEAPGRVLRVAADTLRALLAADTDLASTLLTAFGKRRDITSAGASGLTLVGSRSDPDAVRLGEFVRRNYLPARWLDFENTPAEAAEALAAHGLTAESLDGPVVFWGSQTTLHNPSNLDLARAVGIGTEPRDDERFDLVVVGAGPAGLAAAVYGASEGLSTVVVDEIGTGGQAGASSRIENYLGFPTGISGTNLAIRATVQARKFGARFVTPHQAAALHREPAPAQAGGPGFAVELADGVRIHGRAVVVATGARYRRLAVPGIERFEGAGVYYAATEMEARACDAATAVVVGGGNSAGQAAMFLSERFARVRLLLRGGDLGKSMSHYLTARIEAAPRIEVSRYTEVHAVHGDGRPEGHEALAAVTLADTRAGTTERVATPALFVFVGADPCTEWLRGAAGGLALSTDAHGFICTGSGIPPERLDAARWGALRPDGFETSEPGVFAVGDVRSGSTKRVAGAVGEGSVTVKAVHSRLAAPPVT